MTAKLRCPVAVWVHGTSRVPVAAMLIFKNCGDVFTLAHSRHHTRSSHVPHRLKFLNLNFGHSSQHRVAVVKPTVNKSMYKRMESLSSQGALGRNMSGRQQSPAETWTADRQIPHTRRFVAILSNSTTEFISWS